MSASIAWAPAMATWSWIGRKAGSVERTSSPPLRSARVAIYSPSIPPFVRIISTSSRRRSSLIASDKPKTPALRGYRLNSCSSALARIASRMAGWTGSVFVFWDIHATSLRWACANSKLSFDVMSRPRLPRRSRDASYRLRWAYTLRGAAKNLASARDARPMTLGGKKVVVLAEDGYEDLELWVPYYRMLEAGADVVLAGHEKRTYTSKHSYPCEGDTTVGALDPKEVECGIHPGGVAGTDRLRPPKGGLHFLRKMDRDAKVVAAICHAAWVPISSGIVKGRQMTSYVSVKDDCINAGATWVDKECVVDGTFITSRHPGDLPAFCRAIVSMLSK